jgi:5-methylcytosine-specific restriction endonuclease McrA
MFLRSDGIIRTNVHKFAPAMYQHPGAWSNLFRRSGMSILTDKKQCSKCGEWKNRGEFYKDTQNKDGLGYCCKDCARAKSSKRYAADPKNWIERVCARYWANPQKKKDYDKRRNTIDSKGNVERVQKWRIDNPEKAHQTMYQSKISRRAREKGSVGKITVAEIEALKVKQNYTCLCCKRREPEIELTHDHVKPLAMQGENTVANSQMLCRSCNSRKGAKWIDYR